MKLQYTELSKRVPLARMHMMDGFGFGYGLQGRAVLTTGCSEPFDVEHFVVQGGRQWVGVAALVWMAANAGSPGFRTTLTQPTSLCSGPARLTWCLSTPQSEPSPSNLGEAV
ncbi:hypothetical protein ACFV2H_52825 [Streptomyces sp. NPDC059629]|uniref:hypothetical protein n=1 Tax=Streptomyces sp. NPDC059629 TaxID=3346889 RepID=UPI0036ADF64D